ncbi:MAG: hypothetical protein ACOYON_03560 [Fimbriimonas sp.]
MSKEELNSRLSAKIDERKKRVKPTLPEDGNDPRYKILTEPDKAEPQPSLYRIHRLDNKG